MDDCTALGLNFTPAAQGEGEIAMAYTITPTTEHTGAEVRGLDLTRPVDAETRAALNRAFAQRHVLVVRDQKYEPGDFLQAVQLWGDLQPHD
jgi:taurine dioxygenase